MPAGVYRAQAGPREVSGTAGRVRQEALPARRGVQSERGRHEPLRLVRSGRRLRDGQGHAESGQAR